MVYYKIGNTAFRMEGKQQEKFMPDGRGWVRTGILSNLDVGELTLARISKKQACEITGEKERGVRKSGID